MDVLCLFFSPCAPLPSFLPCLIASLDSPVFINYPLFSSVFIVLSALDSLSGVKVILYLHAVSFMCLLPALCSLRLGLLKIVKLNLLHLRAPCFPTAAAWQNTGPKNKDELGWRQAMVSAADGSVIGEVCGGIHWAILLGELARRCSRSCFQMGLDEDTIRCNLPVWFSLGRVD